MRKTMVAILSRILAQSCLPTYSGKGLRMIVLVSLIASVRRLLVLTVLRMVHPYISIHSGFYTCIYTVHDCTMYNASAIHFHVRTIVFTQAKKPNIQDHKIHVHVRIYSSN